MKLNQIIREKRKELSLTQEQIAERLGVSTPAVNKWEKGSTYPDIMLLPALARLLKTDLNTLLSFQDDLSDMEIENFVNEIDEMVRQQGYQRAFSAALQKIQEYPGCDKLIHSAILYLDGALSLYSITEPEQYRETFETYYRRLSASEIPEIRDTALSMLIAYARNKGEFSKAEELINGLPFTAIDKEEQLAILYQQQKKYTDAEKLWEHRILKGVTQIQTALLNLLETALYENREEDAVFFADRYEAVTSQFSLPEWMQYNAHLMIALDKKDKDKSLVILQKMLPAMKGKWEPHQSPLYRSKESADVDYLSNRLLDKIYAELTENEEYAFLHDEMTDKIYRAELSLYKETK